MFYVDDVDVGPGLASWVFFVFAQVVIVITAFMLHSL